MNKIEHIKNVLTHLEQTEGAGFIYDETSILEELQKQENNTSTLAIKILSILGGLMATLAFLGFLFLGGLYDSYVSFFILGGIFIVGALFITKATDNLVVDTACIALYVTGYILLGVGFMDLNIDENAHITEMMVGIEEERREGKRPHYIPIDDNQMKQVNPPVDLNLYLLFIASNGNYETALRDISSVVGFFQVNPVFDEVRFPDLNASAADPVNKSWQMIDRLSFRLQGMSFEQQNNLWAMLGGKYIPSVVYKVNMLTVFETKSDMAAPAITELNYVD